MAPAKCPECGKDVSDMAESCPHCAYPLKKQAGRNENPSKANADFSSGCAIVVIPIVLLMIVSRYCSDSETSTQPKGEYGTDAVGQIAERRIHRKDYKYWPFTVDEGVLKCNHPLNVSGDGFGEIVFITNGKTYALNGTAQNVASKYGYSDMNEIWDEGDVGDIIADGLKLCK